MQLMRASFLTTALLAALCTRVDSSCSSTSGPAGQYDCISISRYSGKQFATCLTNTYIKLKSGNRHVCEDPFATYCYYQCMMELHSINTGAVTTDCTCQDSTATPTPFRGTTLPPYCYSPSGDSCAWYTDCLEKKITCGYQTGYALTFGKKYCELYSAHYGKFSALTQQWVDAVRKCLQVALVPLMRQFYQPTCDQVKQIAIDSHSGCYLSPSIGQPGICTVMWNSPLDILRIFWTIKGAFVESDQTVSDGTWNSFGDVIETCVVDPLLIFSSFAVVRTETVPAIVPAIVVLKLYFVVKRFLRSKRSTDTEPGQLGVQFATALSNSMGWKQLGIEWIPLRANFTDTDAVTFRLMIGDQNVLDLNRNSSKRINLGDEVQRLQKKVQNGEVSFSLTDGQLYLRQLSECGNFNCTVVNSTVTAPAPMPAPKESGVNQGMSLCGWMTVWTAAVIYRWIIPM